MKKKLLALLMGTSLLLAACGSGDEAGGDDTATSDGEKLYSQNCMQCHGANLEGGAGTPLTTIGATLSKEEIEDVIVKGKGSMPGGLLEGEEASTVAEWLAEKK